MNRTKIIGHISGYSGPKGDDGFSPTINTTPTEDGYKITITDIDGTEEIELFNGKVNHEDLNNLDFDSSGHTGFQEEMTPLTNWEIERMFENE
jgi:hypothetical protein